jgi:hypothetical protein
MPPVTVNIETLPTNETRLRNVDISRSFNRAVCQLRRLQNHLADETFVSTYGSSKRKRLLNIIEGIKEEISGIPLLIEYNAWWYSNDQKLAIRSRLPASKRFPFKTTSNNIVIGSWISYNGNIRLVTGVEFMFKGRTRQCLLHVKEKLLGRNRKQRSFSYTVPLRSVSPLNLNQRLHFSSVRLPLERFVRLVREHLRYKPGSSGFFAAQSDFYSIAN